MSTTINLLIIAATMFGLWGGAHWVVESASKIAKKLGMSELIIGLTVVAFATSAPEFAVTISAAMEGKMGISVGNVVGSNIFNLGIILGLVAIFGVVKTNKVLLYRDGSLLVGTGLILALFFYDLSLSVVEGIIMVLILLAYVIYLIRSKIEIDEEIPEGDFRWYHSFLLVFGVVLIIGSAHFLVTSASEIAREFGISEWMIGITIVAAGTSIPELATSLVALFKGRYGLSIGNLIGSDLFNMLGVLGTASIIRPLTISQSDYYSLLILAAYLIFLFIFMRIGWRITKTEGVIILLIAFFRWWVVSVL
ncbi:MAG: sodium:calcium antiporter [Melioribacteraceae bacterium]|nr:sodium:calcium antiporter [Melioribacteraceae bacterium]